MKTWLTMDKRIRNRVATMGFVAICAVLTAPAFHAPDHRPVRLREPAGLQPFDTSNPATYHRVRRMVVTLAL